MIVPESTEVPESSEPVVGRNLREEFTRYGIDVSQGVEAPVDAVTLADSWRDHLDKIYSDLDRDWSDKSVWNEHDLAAALFIRNFLEDAMNLLPARLRESMVRYVEPSNVVYRSFTVDDPDHLMAEIAFIDPPDVERWWWYRVPARGPIAQDLENQRRRMDRGSAEASSEGVVD